jgi:hypothetical protein
MMTLDPINHHFLQHYTVEEDRYSSHVAVFNKLLANIHIERGEVHMLGDAQRFLDLWVDEVVPRPCEFREANRDVLSVRAL